MNVAMGPLVPFIVLFKLQRKVLSEGIPNEGEELAAYDVTTKGMSNLQNAWAEAWGFVDKPFYYIRHASRLLHTTSRM